MGSFSRIRADKCTKRKNLTIGDKYKILIQNDKRKVYKRCLFHSNNTVSFCWKKAESED